MIRHPRTWAVTLVVAGLVVVVPMLPSAGPDTPRPVPAADAPSGPDLRTVDAPTTGAAADLPVDEASRPDVPTAVPTDASSEHPPVAYRLSREGFHVAAGSGPVVGTYGEVRTYTVEVQPTTGVSLATILPFVRETLEDPDRGWTSHGEVRLQWVAHVEEADLRVVIAEPDTVDRHCAEVDLETYGIFSCWDGERTMLNAWRWEHGARDFGDDLSTYRTYLVNHEVGHALGRTHEECPSEGAVAPVMMQQTVTTGMCDPNGWPWPRTEAVAGQGR